MTQIKLRRDTSANFTSKNPVLGLGEPAYEIDTKKLKIGDGTTAYTQLEYFSAGGGGSANIGATLPLKIVNGVISLEVDGQTIQIVDGKLAASDNMVTTDTAQTISGQKEFNRAILFLGNGDLIRGQQSTSYRNGAGLSMGANTTSTDGGVFAPQWKIYSTTGDVDRTETIVTTYNQSKLNSLNFNTANKLVRLDSDGKLPAIDGSNLTNLPGGSSEPPTNMVTTDTTQTITGTKTFDTKIYTPNIVLSDEFTQSRITSARSDTSSKLQISRPDSTNEYFEIGRSHNMKTCYIKPCDGDTALVINNYGDGDTTSVPAPDVKIYGNVKDGSGNKFLTSGDKETIMGYMTPDFDSGIEVPLNEEYICPYSGYFILQANSTGNMARVELFVYKSDGSSFNAFQCAPNYGGGTESGAFVAIQLSKGTKIKATIPTANKSHYSILFPFKGGLNNA